MQLRRLGRTDLSIAPLVLGGNVFGWTADKKTSFAVLDRFAAAGLTAIDTADVYSAWVPGNKGGESETIIGEWMKARGNRSRVVVITKVGSPMGKGKEGLGFPLPFAVVAALAAVRPLPVEPGLTLPVRDFHVAAARPVGNDAAAGADGGSAAGHHFLPFFAAGSRHRTGSCERALMTSISPASSCSGSSRSGRTSCGARC